MYDKTEVEQTSGEALKHFWTRKRIGLAAGTLAVVLTGVTLHNAIKPEKNVPARDQLQSIKLIRPYAVREIPSRSVSPKRVKGDLLVSSLSGTDKRTEISPIDVVLSECSAHEVVVYGSLPADQRVFDNVESGATLPGKFQYESAEHEVVVCDTANVGEFTVKTSAKDDLERALGLSKTEVQLEFVP